MGNLIEANRDMGTLRSSLNTVHIRIVTDIVRLAEVTIFFAIVLRIIADIDSPGEMALL